MGRGAVRRWLGKRPWWTVFRILSTLEDTWDEWFGQLTLQGIDPRRWDLHQLLAAYEATLQQGAKDESAWKRIRSQLYAEPSKVRRDRMNRRRNQSRERPEAGHGLTLSSVEAFMSGAAAQDARFSGAT